MIARIIVTPKKSVLDPQGEAVRRAIHSLGFDAVSSARIGRYIELEVTGTNADGVRKKLDEIAADLLSNPVVEDYHLEIVGAAPTPTKAAITKAIKAIEAQPELKLKAEKVEKAPAKAKAAPAPAKKAAAPAPKPNKVAIPKAKPAPAKPAAKAKKK
ncbi:MAG TPA: phosphoribosylformylglycinamidine synthase subunit PurS [Candidatus Methylacidiphilales bacterium]